MIQFRLWLFLSFIFCKFSHFSRKFLSIFFFNSNGPTVQQQIVVDKNGWTHQHFVLQFPAALWPVWWNYTFCILFAGNKSLIYFFCFWTYGCPCWAHWLYNFATQHRINWQPSGHRVANTESHECETHQSDDFNLVGRVWVFLFTTFAMYVSGLETKSDTLHSMCIWCMPIVNGKYLVDARKNINHIFI